jgi:hypothetical protein
MMPDMQSTIRPRGVWIILVFYSVSVVLALRHIWRAYSGEPPASGSAAEYLQNPGVLTWTLVGLMLTIAFLAALFKMRRVAITIFTVYIALAVLSILWGIFFTDYFSLFPATPLAEVVVALPALAIPGLIYFYLRALVREGALT